MGLPLRRWLLGVTALFALVTAALYVLAFVMAPRDRGVIATTSSNGEQKTGAEAPSVVGGEAPDEVPVPSKTPSDPRWAFLLMGYAGGAHDGAYLTDSMVLAIVDPSRKTLALLSIPRDTWAPLLFDGRTAVYNKLNTAYAFAIDRTLYPNRLARYSGSRGAGTFVKDTTARLVGVPIANYVALDFAGFRQMIDTVGGIDVDVPSTFISLYPANDNPAIDPSWMTVRFTKGVEHMGGERAIQFARAREVITNVGEGSDFARSRRQRIIMEAFKTRLFQPSGLLRWPQILGIASGHVDTDYAIPDVGQLASLIADWKEMRVYQTALTGDNYLKEGIGPNGTYVLLPVADGSWAQIRAFARRLWQDPETGAAMAGAKITVVNATGESGRAGRLTASLSKLGYRVTAPITGERRATSRLIGSGDAARLLAAQLAKDLRTALPLVSSDSGGADNGALTLELGSDDKALADLVVPPDAMAPSSSVGIQSEASGSSVEEPTEPQATALPRAATPIGVPPSTSTATRTPTAARPRPTATLVAGTPVPGTSLTPLRIQTVARTPVATPTVTAVATRTATWTPSALPATETATSTRTVAAIATPTSTPSATRSPATATSTPPRPTASSVTYSPTSLALSTAAPTATASGTRTATVVR